MKIPSFTFGGSSWFLRPLFENRQKAVDHLEAENTKLRAALERGRDEILGCTGHKDPTVVRELTAIIDGQALGGEDE